MPVDFSRQPRVLVVHGVQAGSDSDVESRTQIRKLIDRSLAKSHLQRDFEVAGFFYEDINDRAQRFYRTIGRALTRGEPLAGRALALVIDLFGDVVSAAADTGTAGEIRAGLRSAIVEAYRQRRQLVLVAHSLGSFYALAVLGELMKTNNYFDGDDRATWPVQGLVTLGSPLGLDVRIGDLRVFDKLAIAPVRGADFEVFPWHNYFNRLDPVVSGRLFGNPISVSAGRGPVEKRYGDDTDAAHWLLRGHAVTSGKQWLFAHTAYWRNSKIGDRLVDMLWG